MYIIKVISLAIILILFPSVIQAQESEGLVQKAYKKFILKEKIAEKKPDSKPQKVSTVREATGTEAKTVTIDNFYKNMSRAEIIQEIKNETGSEEEILAQIPELKRQKGKDEKDIYSYLVEGKQVNLEDVDEKILRTLIAQIGAKAEKLRTSVVMEQQEQVKIISNQDAVVRPPQALPRPPTFPQAPQRPPALPRR